MWSENRKNLQGSRFGENYGCTSNSESSSMAVLFTNENNCLEIPPRLCNGSVYCVVVDSYDYRLDLGVQRLIHVSQRHRFYNVGTTPITTQYLLWGNKSVRIPPSLHLRQLFQTGVLKHTKCIFSVFWQAFSFFFRCVRCSIGIKFRICPNMWHWIKHGSIVSLKYPIDIHMDQPHATGQIQSC